MLDTSLQLSFDFSISYEKIQDTRPPKLKNFKNSCIENIQFTLPELYPEQQDDVLLAEQRFENHKGILFTNGTGTGKTFVGLGIIKRNRLYKNSNVLIVVPTDKKAKDWIKEGKLLNLKINQIKDTKSFLKGISITTYSNFYQNDTIDKLDYSLIVYDECHYLLQNAKGEFTKSLMKHKKIAKLPSSFSQNIKNEIEYYCENKQCMTYDRDLFIKIYNEKLNIYIGKTKVLFLSATPFAYHKSLLIGDGTLWNIYEKPFYNESKFYGYNDTDEWEKFMCESFGYSMRYNKLTTPSSEIDVNLMEREFFEKQKEIGSITGRQIKVNKDYSREFISLDSTIGKRIDNGMNLFHTKEFCDNYPYLSKYKNRKYTYLYISQLLESIKAKLCISRIKQHLELGRKVVVFHSFNNSLPSHPFKFNAYAMLKNKEDEKDLYALMDDIKRFEENYNDLINLDLSELSNPIDALKENFNQTVTFFNGKISKSKRSKNLDNFNNSSDVNITCVQEKAGKEGISMHDNNGKAQRVLIILGLPVQPTSVIQIEGRIYRLNVKSDAIYEYMTLQTNFEAHAFADKIAERSRTAENLAMGNKARNMEQIFKEGYLNASNIKPNRFQGKGGKENDYKFQEISLYDKSKTYYFSTIKKSSKTKSKEGNDYFATPEPLGYKMIQWLNYKPGDRLLEPSSGHGAIARFFPSNTTNTFIEPSFELSSKLNLNTKGKVMIQNFEELNIYNKYEGIVMNPPFGNKSKLAFEHLYKALKHLSFTKNSRVICIVPNGSSMKKLLDKFIYSKEFKDISFEYVLKLPSVVFKRAGTSVSTNILIFSRNETNKIPVIKDFTNINDINMFFNDIENLYL